MTVEYGLLCTNEECSEEYEVKCTYEELQRILEEERCPICTAPLRRKYSVGGIKFNGTGWGGGGGFS